MSIAPVATERRHLRAEPTAREAPLVPKRRRRVLMFVGVMLALAGMAVGLASLLRAAPEPCFVDLWISGHASNWTMRETVAANDRQALRSGDYFSRWQDLPAEADSRHRVLEQLAQLARDGESDRLVAYLAARAELDTQGKLCVLAGGPQSTETVPMGEVLQVLRQCPARHKLLVVDLAPSPNRAPWSTTQDDIIRQLRADLVDNDDPNRLTICACSLGEAPLDSEPWRRSGLGYYFEQALQGKADGWVDGRCNGRVSAVETARYLQAHVARWSSATHGATQSPVLIGDGKDFDLIAVPMRSASREHQHKPSAKAKEQAAIEQPKKAVASKKPQQASTSKKPDKTQATKAAASASKPEQPTEQDYPQWLTAAWHEHAQLCRQRAYAIQPRLFRRWEQSLLRAEEQWRGGRRSQEVQRDLNRQWVAFRSDLQQAKAALPHLQPYSLGLLQSQTPIADLPAAVKALDQLLADVQGKTQSLPPEKAQQVLQSLMQKFIEKTKPLSDDAIAAGAVQKLQLSSDPSPEVVVLLDQVVRLRQPQPLYTETLLLRRLAELAKDHSAQWSPDLVAAAVRVARLQATAAFPGPSFGWTQSTLSAAAQSDHNAQYLLLRPGYAQAEEISQQLHDAEQSFQRTNSANAAIEAAYHRFEEAQMRLPEFLRCSSDQDLQHRLWIDAVDAACRLADTLALEKGRPLHACEHLSRDVDAISLQSESLAGLLSQLQQTANTRIDLLILQGHSTAPASAAAEIDKWLRCPNLAVTQRQNLIAAKKQIDNRLYAQLAAERTLAWANGLLPSNPIDESKASETHATTSDFSRRQLQSLSLLRFGGLSRPTLTELEHEIARYASAKPPLAGDPIRTAVEGILQTQGQHASPWMRARLGSILPAEPKVPWLDTPGEGPYRTLRRQVAEDRNRWLAEMFTYRAHDDTSVLFGDLSRRYGAAVSGFQELYLRFDGPTTVPRPGSANPVVNAELNWQFIGPASHDRNANAFRVLQWGDEVHVSSSMHDQRNSTQLSLELSASPSADGQVDGSGILVEVSADGRVWHWPLAFQPRPWSESLQIQFSQDPSQPGRPTSKFRFRPSAVTQQYYLSLANPTKQTADINVEIVGVGTTPVSIGPQATVPIPFKPKPPPPGEQANGPTDTLVVRLHDAQSGKLLREWTCTFDVLSPAQYVRVKESRFLPGEGGDNRLTVSLQADGMPAGPPCIVQLNLPKESIPGLVGVQGGTMVGELPADGSPLVLSAAGLQLIDGDSIQSEFSLTVDGVPQALAFAADFARRGGPTSPRQVSHPSISVKAEDYALSGPQFQVTTHVLQGPADATIHLRIGKMTAAGFVTEIHQQAFGPRRQNVKVAPLKDGALGFTVALEDWQFELDTSGLVGSRMVVAEIVDPQGIALASAQKTVVFDNSPPEAAYFITAPTEVLVNKPIEMQVAGADAVSGIEKIFVFAGQPVNDKPPEGAKLVPAQLAADGMHWNAEAPPVKQVGTVEMTIQVVNRVGLATYASVPVRVVETLTKSAGAISGVVSEGPRPQPNLTVELKNSSGASIATAKTDAQGAYLFRDVKPGEYHVSASKESSGRKAEQTVKIAAGQTVIADLELGL